MTADNQSVTNTIVGETILAGTLILLPFLALVVAIMAYPGSYFIHPAGDNALVELAVRQVASGDRLTGLYSRFGWHHPGPAYFYLLLPLYALMAENSLSLHLSSLFLNAFTFVALIALVGFSKVSCSSRWLLVIWLLVDFIFLGHGILTNPLNLYLPLCTVFLFLACCAFASASASKKKPAYDVLVALTLLCGSIMVQAHLGMVPLVAGGLVFTIYRRFRFFTWRGVLIMLIFFLLVWYPPLLQQWQAPQGKGNMTMLVHFFTSRESDNFHSFGEAVAQVISRLLLFPRSLNTAGVPAPAWILNRSVSCGVLLGLLISLYFMYRFFASRGRGFERALTEVIFGSIIIAVGSVIGIKGTLHSYLMVWIYQIMILFWMLVSMMLVQMLEPILTRRMLAGNRFIRVGLWFIAFFLSLYATLSMPPHSPASDSESHSIAKLSRNVADFLQRNGDSSVLLQIVDHDTWPVAAGLALALEKRNIHVMVPERFRFLFGEYHAEHGKVKSTIAMIYGRSRSHYIRKYGWRLIAYTAHGTERIAVLWKEGRCIPRYP